MLRREQTKAEEILWRSLRDRQLGAKFRRQVPVGAFLVDFACVEARLVVEVDGPSHETPEGRAQDAWRAAACVARAGPLCACPTRWRSPAATFRWRRSGPRWTR